MQLRFIPAIGVLLAIVLLAVSAARFPGGYQWRHDYISTLLRSAPDRPLPPDVRMPATAALLCFSASLGLLFNQLSVAAPTRGHRKVIQIAGIASMVYASLAMTPMHDLMVTLALVSFLIAAAAILHWLHLRGAKLLLRFGGLSLATLGVAAALYYGGFLGAALAVTQKLSMALCAGWLLWAYDSLIPRAAQKQENA